MNTASILIYKVKLIIQCGLLLSSTLLLSGCFDDKSDLLAFQEKVAQQIKPGIPPIKQIPEFTHIPYQAPRSERTPFTIINQAQKLAQETRGEETALPTKTACAHTTPRTSSHPLQAFALETLIMRGIIYSDEQKKAIIEANDQKLHIVKIGDVIGTFHGNISEIEEHAIFVEEWIPDGLGCFKPRQNQIQLTQSALNE